MSEQKEIAMRVSGMTCAACASRIEKGLKRMPGVTDANVNLATETSNVTFDPAETGAAAIQEKIEKLGYHVITEKAEFDIEGMTCAACANRIEKRLNKIEGVTNAPVNFALETVTIEYNPKETSVTDLKEVVDKLGYKLQPKGDEEREAAASKKKEER
ncbi:copper ion binding protein, partial [Bacillus spizizenii]|nr:copper ion binding protein [Bacillus spizizenii]